MLLLSTLLSIPVIVCVVVVEGMVVSVETDKGMIVDTHTMIHYCTLPLVVVILSPLMACVAPLGGVTVISIETKSFVTLVQTYNE